MIAEPYICIGGPGTGRILWAQEYQGKLFTRPNTWLTEGQWQPYADFEREKLAALGAESIQICPFSGRLPTGNAYFIENPKWFGSVKEINYWHRHYVADSESSRLLKRAEFLKAVCEKENVPWIPATGGMILAPKDGESPIPANLDGGCCFKGTLGAWWKKHSGKAKKIDVVKEMTEPPFWQRKFKGAIPAEDPSPEGVKKLLNSLSPLDDERGECTDCLRWVATDHECKQRSCQCKDCKPERDYYTKQESEWFFAHRKEFAEARAEERERWTALLNGLEPWLLTSSKLDKEFIKVGWIDELRKRFLS